MKYVNMIAVFLVGLVLGSGVMWYVGWLNAQPAFYNVYGAELIELNSRLDVNVSSLAHDVAWEMGDVVTTPEGSESMPSFGQGGSVSKDMDGNFLYSISYTKFKDIDKNEYEVRVYTIVGRPTVVLLECSDPSRKYDFFNKLSAKLGEERKKGGW
ncbi:hypothetical protein JD969_17945 [Planctomycetota bacterium]|nr:hypothetical protein JD969_17945 [Planctomycetota bacterium]